MITRKEISKRYNFNMNDFDEFLRRNNIRWESEGFFGDKFLPNGLEEWITRYQNVLTARADEARRMQEQENAKQQALAQMLISSGFNFEGYKIVKYSGYISGDDVIQIPRGQGGYLFDTTADVGEELSKALRQIRRRALQELKEAAYDLGCNAVIGVDFDYITMDPETASAGGGTLYLPYVFCVTANGNAVVIEKEE